MDILDEELLAEGLAADAANAADEEAEWEVKAVLDSRFLNGDKQYLLEWEGMHESTWTDAPDCSCSDKIAIFEHKMEISKLKQQLQVKSERAEFKTPEKMSVPSTPTSQVPSTPRSSTPKSMDTKGKNIFALTKVMTPSAESPKPKTPVRKSEVPKILPKAESKAEAPKPKPVAVKRKEEELTKAVLLKKSEGNDESLLKKAKVESAPMGLAEWLAKGPEMLVHLSRISLQK